MSHDQGLKGKRMTWIPDPPAESKVIETGIVQLPFCFICRSILTPPFAYAVR